MAAGVTSNRAEVVAGVRAFSRMGFRGKGRWGSFADDFADAVAQHVYARTALEQRDPDGRPLAPLAASTLLRKARLGFPDTILVARGLMLRLDQLRGEVESDDRTVTMTYGTEPVAVAEAGYAHEGAANRPPRPFYELSEPAPDLDALADDALDAQAADLGAE